MSLGIVMAAALAAVPAPAQVAQGATSYPAAYFTASSPTTALQMVGLLPGFSFDKGDAVRGFGGAGNVLIDGARPASKDDALDQILKRIPASSVLRIEVIRGGAPGIDMQGKTVLANVIRRQDIAGKLTVTASGTHAYDGRLSGVFQLEGEKRSGATAFEGSLLAQRSLDDGAGNGPWTRSDGGGGLILNAHEASQGAELNFKATGSVETPALGGKLKINGSLLIDPYAYTEDDRLVPQPGREFDHLRNRQDTAELGLRFERPLGPRASLEVFALQQQRRQRTQDDFTGDAAAVAITGDSRSANFDLRKQTSESIARATVKIEAGKTLSLQVGGEGDFNALHNQTGFIQDGTPIALPAANVRVTETRGEGFATATWRARPTLTIEAGLRTEVSRIASSGDVVSGRSLVFAKPRVAVAWSPDPADQLRMRVEREVGQLNFDDFTAQSANLNTGTVQAGNPNLNPGQDWVYEAAWDRRFWSAGDVTVTFRHLQLTDAVDRVPVFDPAGTFDSPGNIGSGTKDELAFTLTLPTDRLGVPHGLLTGQATLRRSRVIDPTTGLTREISGLHPNDWEAHFTQGFPKWKATWGFDIFGQFRQTFYRFNEVDTDKIKTFVLLFAEFKPRTDLSIRTEILNVGARGVEHAREVFTGPRNLDPLAFTDVRNLHTGRFLRLRVVKTFG